MIALCAALFANPAAARAAPEGNVAIHEKCFSYGTLDETIAQVASDRSRWNCSRHRPLMSHEKVFFRFEIAEDDRTPYYFLSRRSVFETLSLMVVDEDGTTRSSTMSYSKVQPAQFGYMFKAPLPKVTQATRTVYAAIALPTQRIMLEQAIVAPQDPGFNPESAGLMFLLATVCGMLLMPLILNLGAWRVLREPFLLWHVAMLVSIILLILMSSGLYSQIITLPPRVISFTIVISFAAFIASVAMFAFTYLEPDKVSPRLWGLLPYAAIWVMVAGLLHASFPFALRAIQSDLYYAAFLPVLVLFIVGLADALRRGSRAAKFQLFGWVPLLLLGVVRLTTTLLPFGPASDAMPLFYIGCVLDALATTLGVLDRFMTMKRERDRAEAQARTAEDISERDPLTGLLNRRAIEPRFSALHAEGFETLAVIDLDHFKSVNDTLGHTKGDEVLKVAASALVANKDTLAMRLGGEEFMLLLRGKDAMRRAEQYRRAITSRIAAEVNGLDRMVTASMGIVQVPIEAMPDAMFADLYTRADRLLYEAKAAGRNRTMHEKLKVFRPRKAKERRTAA